MVPSPVVQPKPLNRFLPDDEPALTFAPLAWLKLRHFLHSDQVEVGGFGISAASDLLYLEDFVTVKQTVTIVSVEFDDAAVADHFDRCADVGIGPGRCGRVWVHTHPGDSSHPSLTDEQTFARVFGNCDWSVMAIVARGGERYARLQFTAGPGGSVVIPIRVDWERFPNDLIDSEGQFDQLISSWMDEYGSNVFPRVMPDFLHSITPSKGPPKRDRLWDDLDRLYDDRVLHDRSIDLFERGQFDALLETDFDDDRGLEVFP